MKHGRTSGIHTWIALSMEIMDELGIQYVLTFDSDFHGEGRYVVLPGPASTRRPQS